MNTSCPRIASEVTTQNPKYSTSMGFNFYFICELKKKIIWFNLLVQLQEAGDDVTAPESQFL